MTQKATQKRKALTAEEILGGGDGALRVLEIPEWKKGTRVGLVYLAEPKAGDVLDFASKQEAHRAAQERGAESSFDMTAEMTRMISRCVVDEKGAAIFDEESAAKLREVSVSVFRRISEAVTGMMGEDEDAEGNESSGATGSASPTG